MTSVLPPSSEKGGRSGRRDAGACVHVYVVFFAEYVASEEASGRKREGNLIPLLESGIR